MVMTSPIVGILCVLRLGFLHGVSQGGVLRAAQLCLTLMFEIPVFQS